MRLLIADDDRVTRDLLREVFEGEGYEVDAVASGEEALVRVRAHAFDVVLSDIRMVDVDGFRVLHEIRKLGKGSVVILMTGFGTMEGAIQAVRDGAFDYLSKPFKIQELKAVVRRAVEHNRARDQFAAGPPRQPIPTPKALIGKSPQIVEVYKTVARATLSPSYVLIVGESGTGKELVARAIHEYSPRAGKPFVAVNCGALAETLLESELFGHVKGAFTGAMSNKTGLVEEARGGTLFLDEIGDVSPGLQVKLLRVIQEGELKPVGSTETRIADARVIAATHRDLEASVAEGKFREDLYYRLKVVLIRLPPLRERMSDLSDLVEFFLRRFADKIGRPVSHVSDEAMRLLHEYRWPGNVRELEHAIERAITMTRTSVLYPEDFPPEIRVGASGREGAAGDTGSLEAVEKSHIRKVLEDTAYNQSRAAEILGIDRKTLYRKAKRYGIALKRG